MEQHAIPRDVTGFSFKLIGFMTLRQFIYLIVAAFVGYMVFLISPIVIVGQVLGVMIFGVGLLFAFVPINDRPIEVFAKNLYFKLTRPTQYIYHKSEPPLTLLAGLYYEADPHIVYAHVDSKEKLSSYLAQKHTAAQNQTQKTHADAVSGLLRAQPQDVHASKQDSARVHDAGVGQTPLAPATETSAHPFISGTVTNRKRIPLPGVLVYVKDPITGKTLRILKTNPHGVFASFHPLPVGEYVLEAADTAKNYVFDPQTLLIANSSNTVSFVSRELLS